MGICNTLWMKFGFKSQWNSFNALEFMQRIQSSTTANRTNALCNFRSSIVYSIIVMGFIYGNWKQDRSNRQLNKLGRIQWAACLVPNCLYSVWAQRVWSYGHVLLAIKSDLLHGSCWALRAQSRNETLRGPRIRQLVYKLCVMSWI